jgi:uncharacterized protein
VLPLPDVSVLEPVLQRLREHYRPEEIWLFGSRARGTARVDSDWDLLAIVPDDLSPSLFEPMTAWQLLRFDEVGADVAVFPRREFDEDVTTPNTLPFAVRLEGLRIQ